MPECTLSGESDELMKTLAISRRDWLKSTCALGLSATASDLISSPVSAQSNEAQTPINVGSRKQLFIDNSLIEANRDVTLTMNPPQRDGRVLIAPDATWEQGASIAVYSSVLKENGRIRVWYDLIRPTGPGPYDHTRRVCYAESTDGLQFKKPILNLHEVNGDKKNNVVLPGVIGGCAVWIDPRAPTEHRYKTQTKVYPTGQFHMHSSPDGLRWKKFARLDPGPGGWDTQSIVFWDARIERYVLYTRRWVRLKPKAASYRTVRRLESDDLISWEKESVVMQADDVDLSTHSTGTDQPPVDYYGADVFQYPAAQDAYLMLAQPFWHWRERKPLKGLGPSSFDVRLAVSRDGKAFQLASRQPFMPNGPAGRFDSRYVWAMPHPIPMGDELWIYYVGSNRDHDGNIDPVSGEKHLTGISRAVLRRDGFVSADANRRGGQFTTPPIRFEGNRLEINAVTTSRGSIRVEVQDAFGTAIDGFAISNADVIAGDHVRKVVTWDGSRDVKSLMGKPVRLRFVMNDAKLFAFQFVDDA